MNGNSYRINWAKGIFGTLSEEPSSNSLRFFFYDASGDRQPLSALQFNEQDAKELIKYLQWWLGKKADEKGPK